MAEATSREDCIARHTGYSIDVGTRLHGMQRDRLRAMAAHVRPGDRVLDVGCNSGYFVDFVPKGCEVHGVDVSVDLVERAKARLVSAQIAPAEELPFGADEFDAVILGEILEHVFDPIEALREAVRVSRRLVIGSTPHEAGKWGPNGPRPPATHRHHVRCYTEPELRADLEAAGLIGLVISEVERDGAAQIRVFAGNVP